MTDILDDICGKMKVYTHGTAARVRSLEPSQLADLRKGNLQEITRLQNALRDAEKRDAPVNERREHLDEQNDRRKYLRVIDEEDHRHATLNSALAARKGIWVAWIAAVASALSALAAWAAISLRGRDESPPERPSATTTEVPAVAPEPTPDSLTEPPPKVEAKIPAATSPAATKATGDPASAATE